MNDKEAIILGVVLLGVALYITKKAPGVVSGIVTGDNAVTRNATDASGQPVTAYQGAGVLGTAGAVANAASGGTLASFGEWIGGKVYDWTHPNQPDPTAPTPTSGVNWSTAPDQSAAETARLANYERAAQTSAGTDNVPADYFTDPATGYPYSWAL